MKHRLRRTIGMGVADEELYTPERCGVGKKRNHQDDDSTDEDVTRTYKKPRTLARYAGSQAITSSQILNGGFGVHRGRNGGMKDDPEKKHHAEHPEFRLENTTENVSRGLKMKRRVAPRPINHYAIYIDNSRGLKKMLQGGQTKDVQTGVYGCSIVARETCTIAFSCLKTPIPFVPATCQLGAGVDPAALIDVTMRENDEFQMVNDNDADWSRVFQNMRRTRPPHIARFRNECNQFVWGRGVTFDRLISPRI
jgi:hypothetical protein